MGAGRWVVAGVLFSLACAGKSTSQDSSGGPRTDAGGDPPTGAECKTSFACPTGERCDEGACVSDDNCADAREPELLFEAPPGASWTKGWADYFTVLEGREYLVMTELDDSGSPTEVSRFLDLRTGRELLFVHRPGYVGCYGTPARCSFSSTGARAIAEIEIEGDTVSFREGTLVAFSGYDLLLSSDTDYRDSRVVVTAGTLVELWTLGEPAPIASIDLVDKNFMQVLVGADGRSERVLSSIQANPATGEPAEVAVTALANGASPTLIYGGPGGFSGLRTLPNGDSWYVLRDGIPFDDEEPVYVYRTNGGDVTLVGIHDTSWAVNVDREYQSGERPLEPGPSAYVRHCEESGCGSYRFWLDLVSLEEVGRVPLPEPRLREHYSRRIACGGADIWVVTRASDDAPTRYWSLRIPGRPGLP